MHDPVQLLPLPPVIEYHGPKFLPVQVSIRLKDIFAKRLDDSGIGGRARQNRFSCEQVRVDDRVSTGSKERRNGRLPGCDTACEADDCSVPKLQFLLSPCVG